MAKINLTYVLWDLGNVETLKGPVDKEGIKKDLTLGLVCTNSLLVFDERMTGQDKYERYKLARKLEKAKDGQVDLKAEEIASIKDAIGKYQTPLVVGQAWDLLENVQEEVNKS